MTSTRAIAPSLAPVQTPLLAPVPISPTRLLCKAVIAGRLPPYPMPIHTEKALHTAASWRQGLPTPVLDSLVIR